MDINIEKKIKELNEILNGRDAILVWDKDKYVHGDYFKCNDMCVKDYKDIKYMVQHLIDINIEYIHSIFGGGNTRDTLVDKRLVNDLIDFAYDNNFNVEADKYQL